MYLLAAHLTAMSASDVKRINEQRIGKHREGTAVAPSSVRRGACALTSGPLTYCTHTARWKEPCAQRGVWFKQYLREL